MSQWMIQRCSPVVASAKLGMDDPVRRSGRGEQVHTVLCALPFLPHDSGMIKHSLWGNLWRGQLIPRQKSRVRLRGYAHLTWKRCYRSWTDYQWPTRVA